MSEKNNTLFDAIETLPIEPHSLLNVSPPKDAHKIESKNKRQEGSSSIYQSVLPIILNALNSPAKAEDLSKMLDVNNAQIKAWLKKAIDENRVVKLSRPVRYQKKNSEGASFF